MKFLLTFLTLVLFNFSFAQFDVFKVGGGLCYGTEIEQPGIVLKGNTNITEVIDVSASINIFFPDKTKSSGAEAKFSMWTINVDGHYLFPLNDKTTAFGLAGINIASWKSSVDYDNVFGFPGSFEASDTEFGLNIGGGAEMALNDKLTGFAELKYTISDLDQLVISLGALINLGKSE